MADLPIQLNYDRGTVVVSGGPDGFSFQSLPGVLFDPRTSTHRAQGRHYRAIVEQLIREKHARTRTRPAAGPPSRPAGSSTTNATPRDYQKAALAAWIKARRGVVVMPTGTGKTFAAFLCIEKVGRPTLVVTPKIDLMVQWAQELERAFGVEVGMVGAGEFNYKPLTVTTYDSAYIHLERWANRFGMVIFDECHHLPGASYMEAANAGLAPFRLGLTATPERTDGGDAAASRNSSARSSTGSTSPMSRASSSRRTKRAACTSISRRRKRRHTATAARSTAASSPIATSR